MGKLQFSLRRLLIAFVLVGLVVAGCPLNGSATGIVYYLLWTLSVGCMWLILLSTSESDLSADPNRNHSLHILLAIMGVATIIWLAYVASGTIARYKQGLPVEHSAMVMAGPIALFAPFGFTGTWVSTLMCFHFVDWKLHLVRAFMLAASVLPLLWILSELQFE